MVVRIRLARHGTRNNPFYHIVAIADHKPRDARPIEKLGEYDPIPRPRVFKIPKLNPDAPVLSSGIPEPEDVTKLEKRLEWNSERISWWLSKGAQPSKPLAKMLDKANLIPEGLFFKGMYRPPTEEGIAQLEARKGKSGTEVRSEIRTALAADAERAKQAQKAENAALRKAASTSSQSSIGNQSQPGSSS